MIEFERPKPLSNSLSITPLDLILFSAAPVFYLRRCLLRPEFRWICRRRLLPLNFRNSPRKVVYISRLGEIYWNDDFMPIDDLSQAYAEPCNNELTDEVTIKADKEVAFGLFVRVMDIVKAAGGRIWSFRLNFRSKKADIMLRVSFLASVGLHVLIVSLVSVCVSPRERHISLSEQRFPGGIPQAGDRLSSGQADTPLTSVPRKAMALPQFEPQRDISLPLSMVQRR